jgi:hypothetical protein
VWLLAGVWKPRGIRNKMEKIRCLLCLGKDVKHILLKCSEIEKWRKEFLGRE